MKLQHLTAAGKEINNSSPFLSFPSAYAELHVCMCGSFMYVCIHILRIQTPFESCYAATTWWGSSWKGWAKECQRCMPGVYNLSRATLGIKVNPAANKQLYLEAATCWRQMITIMTWAKSSFHAMQEEATLKYSRVLSRHHMGSQEKNDWWYCIVPDDGLLRSDGYAIEEELRIFGVLIVFMAWLD